MWRLTSCCGQTSDGATISPSPGRSQRLSTRPRTAAGSLFLSLFQRRRSWVSRRRGLTAGSGAYTLTHKHEHGGDGYNFGDLVSADAATQVPGGSRSACALLSLSQPAGSRAYSCFVLLDSLSCGPISPIWAGRLSRSRPWQPRGCSTAAAVTTWERRLCPAKIFVSAVTGRSADSS